MTVLIDPPRWPAHGRLWSHLVSDESLAELHAFADAAGIPRRAFSGDHYDVPEDRHAELVAAGARAVEGRVLLARLVASGLRVPKRRGERLLDSRRVGSWRGAGPGVLDLVASGLPLDPGSVVAVQLLDVTADGVLLVPDGGTWTLPPGAHDAPSLGYHRLRPDAGPRVVVRYVGPAAGADGAGVTGAAGVTPATAERVRPGDLRTRSVQAWPLVAVLAPDASA